MDVVADPVSHISISGVHGRDELAQRLADAPTYRQTEYRPVATLLAGFVIGAALVYLIKR
jgi:hypothetical protein